MCYLTIYIGEVLRFVQKYKTKAEAQKNITQLSMSGNFSIPGDSGFPLAGFFSAPKNRAEGGTTKISACRSPRLTSP